MYKALLTISIMMVIVFKLQGQIPENLKFQLQNSKPDTNRISMLMNLGRYYLNRPSEYKKERDHALGYLQRALRLSMALKESGKERGILLLTGKYYFIKNDTAKGRAYFMRVIKAYQAVKDNTNEAAAWEQYGDCLSVENENLPRKVSIYSKAAELYQHSNKTVEKMAVLLKVAQSHLSQNKVDQAEEELKLILNTYQLIGYKKIHYVYDLMADISQAKSDLHKELQYRLGVIKSMETSQDTVMAYYFYERLAITYADLGEYQQSLNEVLKSLEIMKRTNQLADYYGYLSLVSFDLLSLKRPKAALAYLQKASKEIPPFNIAQREDLFECYGNCYVALKQYDKAETFYLELMRDFKKTQFNQDYYSSNSEMITDFIHYYKTLGSFYVLTRQYRKADFFLQQVLKLPKGTVRPVWLSQMYLDQFRVDSATGKYLAAIQHFQMHKRINDSLFNVVKIKQISEVQTNYQIRQKEASIRMLTSQAKLEAQKTGFQRRVAISGFLMLVVIAGIAYNGYRNKRRSNFELQFQQIEINQQNAKLQGLIVEKDKILLEKDWLLKEVHHRVKNNLQIVMSLLNTQSAYLKNNAAIEAISDSQNRVQAISLIHHKLYNTSNVSNIDMPAYISDLVQYLSDCFDTAQKGIQFEQKIDAFEMELSQAIPIGLILNEAITNAIKHAFEEPDGKITIGLKLINKHQVLLTLSDNGKGLAPDFHIAQATTLGMEMMKALSTQLSGDFRVENRQGVCLRILFNLEKTAVDLNAEFINT